MQLTRRVGPLRSPTFAAAQAAPRWARIGLPLLVFGALYSAPGRTAVLPEDEVDFAASRYDGGGQVIDGKNWLIRKKIGDKVSVQYNHLTDVVSGASIDVQLSASPYIEQRTQDSGSIEYLYGKSTFTAGYTHSYEPDYRSDTASFSISEDMFGDLTTVTMSYRRTWNDVYKMLKESNGDKIHDPSFGKKDMDQSSYGIGLTQILTRNSILAANFEVITDQGWLSNPYREVAYLDPTAGKGFSLEPETDPNTRTSNAIGLDYKYYLPYRAAIDVQYRYFSDTWGIRAHTVQLGYTHPWHHWIFDGSVRYYTQTQADFYANVFQYANEQNFMSRNRELSNYDSYSIGAGASYEFAIPKARWTQWIQKSTASIRYDHMSIDYKNFTNALLVDPANGVTIENAPLYNVSYNIFQIFFSIFY
ncbi:MAG TPA: DUF3570 domain-containing protein [Steroidobacteraceae bacterium]|nr:DUF3570 domain-containing protein [Steroidobacteraceae bacterium]